MQRTTLRTLTQHHAHRLDLGLDLGPRLGQAIALWQVETARAEQDPRQFDQRELVDLALELDHRLERHPIMAPTPGIEFRMRARAQTDVRVAPHQSQQQPDLLLPTVGVAPLAPYPVLVHFVAQPAACAAENPAVLRTQPDFLEKLPVHGLLGRFAVLDATLGELPGMFADTLAPEHLITRIDQNDADVRAKAFTVKHEKPSISVD